LTMTTDRGQGTGEPTSTTRREGQTTHQRVSVAAQ